MNFKKGDILEFDGKGIFSAKKGAKAICKGYCKTFITVEWIRDELSNEQRDGGYYEYHFTKTEYEKER